jgi:hypothetical protein
MNIRLYLYLAGIILLLLVVCAPGMAQSTGFTYQGRLSDTNLPANGTYDFEFKLFTALGGGTQEGTTRQFLGISVTNGVFSVVIDFGAGAFPGADRFLEIAVRQAGSGSFTTLSPRQQVNPTPYAINAANSSQLGGVFANQFVLTGDTRLSDFRNPLPNSANYIQNRSTQQTTSNFNISGNGTAAGTLTANIISATTQFNLGGNRILSNAGSSNLFAGSTAGAVNTGGNNSFYGAFAGRLNTSGQSNAFFGANSGTENLTGIFNSFFGAFSGQLTTGSSNSFFGQRAGQMTEAGNNNTFLGASAGDTNAAGSNNTIIGFNADLATDSLSNAAAIGSQALVERSNSLVLGSISGVNGATENTTVGIGTTKPFATLDLERQFIALTTTPILGLTTYGGEGGNFFGTPSIGTKAAGGTRAAPAAIQDNNSLFTIKVDGYTGSGFSNNGGQGRIVFSATEDWSTTAHGTEMLFFTTPNGSTSAATQMRIENNGNVGIGISSATRKLDVNGILRVGSTTGTIGCVEDRDGTVIAGSCSSDLRFKKNITSIGNLLHNFSKLRPVNFFWRSDEFADRHFGSRQSYGLIAQEVEKLFPELVSTDEQGYKVVNYSRLPLLTIQAVKELKQENDVLKARLEGQQAEVAKQLQQQKLQLEALRKLFCSQNPQADLCR